MSYIGHEALWVFLWWFANTNKLAVGFLTKKNLFVWPNFQIYYNQKQGYFLLA